MEHDLPDQDDRCDGNHQRCDEHRTEAAASGAVAHQDDGEQQRQNDRQRNCDRREGQCVFDCHTEGIVVHQHLVVFQKDEIFGDGIVQYRLIDDDQKRKNKEDKHAGKARKQKRQSHQPFAQDAALLSVQKLFLCQARMLRGNGRFALQWAQPPFNKTVYIR